MMNMILWSAFDISINPIGSAVRLCSLFVVTNKEKSKNKIEVWQIRFKTVLTQYITQLFFYRSLLLIRSGKVTTLLCVPLSILFYMVPFPRLQNRVPKLDKWLEPLLIHTIRKLNWMFWSRTGTKSAFPLFCFSLFDRSPEPKQKLHHR